MKYIILNIVFVLLGIFLCCLSLGYLKWYLDFVDSLQWEGTFFNITLFGFALIVPLLVLIGGGLLLVIKTLYDPFQKTNY